MKRVMVSCSPALGLLAFTLMVLPLSAQEMPCRMQLDEWKIPTYEHSQLSEGDTLYLSADYSLMIRENLTDVTGSPLAQLRYLRPSSRKEFKRDTIHETRLERLGNDGNVYAITKVPIGAYLFEIPAGYKGSVNIKKEANTWVVAAGLLPWKPEEGQSTEFLVEEVKAHYVVLRSNKRRYVFYPVGPGIATAFLRAQDQRKMEQLRVWARSLRGREIRVTPEAGVRVTTGLAMEVVRPVEEATTFTVYTVFVLRDRVMFGIGGQDFLVIDAPAEGEIRAIGCQDPIWNNIFRSYPGQ